MHLFLLCIWKGQFVYSWFIYDDTSFLFFRMQNYYTIVADKAPIETRPSGLPLANTSQPMTCAPANKVLEHG